MSAIIDETVFVVAGLGNPGKKYQNTRHNVGFDVLDHLLKRFPGAIKQGKFNGKYVKLQHQDRKLILLWPETFMNLSGSSIQAAMQFFKTPVEALLVVCDDLSLPTGKLRLRSGGSSGGQKGLQNTIDQLGTNQFARLRIGIDATPPSWETADYVLGQFDAVDKDVIERSCEMAADAISCWISDGIGEAMNRFNSKA